MCITCRWENKRILEFSSQNIEIEQNLNRADFSSVISRTRACVYLCSRMMWADSINHLIPKVIDLLCKSHRDSHESRVNQSGTHANYLGLISIGMRNNKAPYTKRGRAMRPPTKGSFAPVASDEHKTYQNQRSGPLLAVPLGQSRGSNL